MKLLIEERRDTGTIISFEINRLDEARRGIAYEL